MYAAIQPFSHASERRGARGATGADDGGDEREPEQRPTAGSASAFAGTPSSGTAPNWSQRIGAVAAPQAAETATIAPSLRGTG